jgi:DNA-nicking Smr family endonuclease
MSKAGQRSGRSGRLVTSDEAELWQQATRTAVPLKGKPRIAAAASPQGAMANAATPFGPGSGPGSGPESGPRSKSRSEAAPKGRAAGAVSMRPAAIDVLDRRQARRIGAGKTDIEGRLDLHGLYQAEAHARLRAFLQRAYAGGLKTVLVITGKGREEDRSDPLRTAMGERQRGVLRRSVPLWLAQPDLSQIVLSYGAAGTRHGGAGAFYVCLRKPTRSA